MPHPAGEDVGDGRVPHDACGAVEEVLDLEGGEEVQGDVFDLVDAMF